MDERTITQPVAVASGHGKNRDDSPELQNSRYKGRTGAPIQEKETLVAGTTSTTIVKKLQNTAKYRN